MNQRNAFILFAIIVTVWGINWTVTKMIVLAMPPLWSNALRSIIAAAAILLLQLATKQFILPKKRDIPAILAVSLFHMTIFASLMAIGLQYASVGRSVILGYTTPLWVTPAALLFLREPFTLPRGIGVFLGIIGIGILFNPFNLQETNPQELIGNIILLIAAFSWAITIVGIKAVTWHASPFQLVFWQLLLAASLSAIVALCIEGIPNITFTSSLIWQLGYSALFSTAFGFWGMTVINRLLPAVVTSLGLLVTPIIGIAFSLYMLGEEIDTQLILSGACILFGIALGSIPTKEKK